MHEQREPALCDCAVERKQLFIVDVEFLKIRMKLDAAQPEGSRAVKLFFKVCVVRMNGSEGCEAVVVLDDLRHKIGNGFGLLRCNSSGADEKMRDTGGLPI